MRRVSVVLALVALLGILPGVAQASVMIEASIQELAREAEVVARGTVVSTESRWSSDGRRIFTVVRLRVDEAWKGKPAEEVEIRVPGGSLDGIGQIVQGAARFQEGEEVVVFLQPAGKVRLPDQPMNVVSMAQGKLEIRADAAGVEIAAPNLEGMQLVERKAPHTREVEAPAPRPVAEIEQLVRAAGR